MRKETEELLHEIEEAQDIRSFLEANEAELLHETAKEFLDGKLREKNLKIADVAKRSAHGDYVYKVFAGTREPTREVLIDIAFALSLDVAETQMLLRLSGTARLDPRVRRDAATLYAIDKKMDVARLNELLYDMGEPTY